MQAAGVGHDHLTHCLRHAELRTRRET
ncbi:MAG: hypothetical protein O3B24_06995 [Verrucomicrobia bacterium]|nr:hypothetical protein [Verrucomicrobiota bacterium]